jgi:hypothetical protein
MSKSFFVYQAPAKIFVERAGARYLDYFARSRHTNPARIPSGRLWAIARTRNVSTRFDPASRVGRAATVKQRICGAADIRGRSTGV